MLHESYDISKVYKVKKFKESTELKVLLDLKELQ